jgi:hypothetical protein
MGQKRSGATMTPPISRRQLHPEGSRTDAALEELMQAIKISLRTFRCQHTIGDDEGNGQRLVDMLTPPGDKTITNGLDELNLLADHLYRDLIASRNSPDAQVGAIGEPVAWAIAFSDGTVGELGWSDMKTFELAKKYCVLAEGWSYVFAYAAPQPPSAPSQSGEVAQPAKRLIELAEILEIRATTSTELESARALRSVAQLQGELARLRGDNEHLQAKVDEYIRRLHDALDSAVGD